MIMGKAVLKLVAVFAVFVLFFILQRLLFLGVYQGVTHASPTDWLRVLAHGHSMDLSVAGYLSVIPALLITIGLWLRQRGVDVAFKLYSGIVSALLAIITALDIALYGYWGFRLDMTPVFYFTTSPASALASTEWWQIPMGLVAMLAIASGLYLTLTYVWRRIKTESTRRGASTAVMLILTALLFIPIRGGVTVSTMNLSRAYFSANQRLNHAAINPAFSLLYSATHQHDFGSQYRFMEQGETEALVASLEETLPESERHNILTDSPLLSYNRPHIYLIILESFSSHLMPGLGGEAVATGLDSIAREGISFTDIYDSSFRTDRALPAILSGFPGQPSMSLMKYVEKIEKLPSIAGMLAENGYNPSYYYGGDINFTNMNAYLVHSGFSKIISDKDFPIAEKTGKWGAPDHAVFDRALADASSRAGKATPEFNVIQTSSSHEPFDVPFASRFSDKRLNAFAYTDSCLTAFVDSLSRLPGYDRTLVVIVPDHYGAYPDRPDEILARHSVPLVMTGGALGGHRGEISVTGSQTDIAATLAHMLGLPADRFLFSHNLLDATRKGYAFMSEPGIAALVTPTDTVAFDCDAMQTLELKGADPARTMEQAKAYLQTIYSSIADM